MWMAGGGSRPAAIYGETDDFSYNVVKDRVLVRDFHATVLHLLGFEHERFTFRASLMRIHTRKKQYKPSRNSLLYLGLQRAGDGTRTRDIQLGKQQAHRVAGDISGPTLALHYHQGETDVQMRIPLQATYPAFGGLRWWFTCPLIVNGVACNRRVGKLFLPPGAQYFGCRHCHNLSYRSSQEAHQWERIAVLLGFDPEVGALLNSRRRGKRVNW
jgi:hypothetical protein